MSRQRPSDPVAEWFGGLDERVGIDRWQPAADVYETEKAIVVRCELSGVASSDVQVTVDGDLLRIRGVRKPRMEAEAQRLHRMEIAFGPFERLLRIQVPFERSQVSARLEEGFLRVTLPKRLPAQRRVEIRSEPGDGPEGGAR
ncbi:MAG: Hsp20/alpha crystallin family protein [Myxococcota bacterium]|nr:Hsp20/alpha crystallin family protein [Myxococcota bacterium]